MTTFQEFALLQKLLLLQTSALKPLHQQLSLQSPNVPNRGIYPTFMRTEVLPRPQSLFASPILRTLHNPIPMGKHSCSTKPPTVIPTVPFNPTLTYQSRPQISPNLNTYTPNFKVSLSMLNRHSPQNLLPKLNFMSKKINKNNSKKKVFIKKPVKKIWFLPREKKNRKVASQIVRASKCTESGCSKAYGSEASMKFHVKIKHLHIKGDESKNDSSLKTEELSN